MEPFLILTDTERITNAQLQLDGHVEQFQLVYNAIDALLVTPTLADIQLLLQKARNLRLPNFHAVKLTDFVFEYIIEKLLDKSAPYNLNGVQLQRSKVREMMTPPNVEPLRLVIEEASYQPDAILELMTLTSGVIAKVANADAIMEARYTYYTKTDASTTRALQIQAFCDALNTLEAQTNNMIAGGLVGWNNHLKYKTGQDFKITLPGISWRNGAYHVSLSYIRSFEETRAV